MKTRPRVLHVTAEFWPYARTGGLGQAVYGLSRNQAAAGLDVTVVLPLYREARAHAGELEPFCDPFVIDTGGFVDELRCWKRMTGPVTTIFLENDPAFDRPNIYGNGSDYADNHLRFAMLASAALHVAKALGTRNLLLHAHDWHAALAPLYLRRLHRHDPELRAVPSVLTVHNGGFQGVFPYRVLEELRLPQDLWSLEFMEWYGRLNFLKGGLVFADMVTTVSPTHAFELLTEVGGFGLHHVFNWLGDRLVGIRNGIDVESWDPASDPEIDARYSVDDFGGKALCKTAVQEAWGLPPLPDVPLFAMSARLVMQKGLDQIVASRALREEAAQFVFIGAGEYQFEHALRELSREYPDRIAFNREFTDALEHRLLAGADFLMMPSLYEPCGLTQMRAQRYGALPIARRVGGLADTIEDGVTGILYDAYSPEAFDRAVHRAMTMYRDRDWFTELARGAMRKDFSWKEPVAEYLDVYRRAFAARAIPVEPAVPRSPATKARTGGLRSRTA
jgi:starch synthase